MDNDQKREIRQIQIRIPESVLHGSYANILRVDATREEFILDFGAIHPQQGNGTITNRIFMNPGHVKRMIEVLQRAMQHYESRHGQVHPSEQDQEIGFHTS